MRDFRLLYNPGMVRNAWMLQHLIIQFQLFYLWGGDSGRSKRRFHCINMATWAISLPERTRQLFYSAIGQLRSTGHLVFRKYLSFQGDRTIHSKLENSGHRYWKKKLYLPRYWKKNCTYHGVRTTLVSKMKRLNSGGFPTFWEWNFSLISMSHVFMLYSSNFSSFIHQWGGDSGRLREVKQIKTIVSCKWTPLLCNQFSNVVGKQIIRITSCIFISNRLFTKGL